MAREAAKESDPLAAATMLDLAAQFRASWRCPGSSPTEPEADEYTRSRVQYVERLTGVRGLKTCPQWYASRPWAHVAAQARRWREHGHLEAVATPHAAMIAAIEEIDAGVSARQQDDDARRERERKK